MVLVLCASDIGSIVNKNIFKLTVIAYVTGALLIDPLGMFLRKVLRNLLDKKVKSENKSNDHLSDINYREMVNEQAMYSNIFVALIISFLITDIPMFFIFIGLSSCVLKFWLLDEYANKYKK